MQPVLITLNDGKEYKLILTAYGLMRFETEFKEDFYEAFRKLRKGKAEFKDGATASEATDAVDETVKSSGMSLTKIFLLSCQLLWACMVQMDNDLKYEDVLKLVDFANALNVTNAVVSCMVKAAPPLAEGPAKSG